MHVKKSKTLSRCLCVAGILTLSTALLSWPGSADAAKKKTFELSLSVMWGSNMAFVADVIPKWNAYLDKATDGQLKIVVYPGGTLSKATEAYEGVVQGVSDMAAVAYPLTRGRFPVIETFVLPGIQYNNSVAATLMFNEGMQKLKPAEHNDAHFLWGFATGPGEIQSQVPVRSRKDLKGLEIAVNSGDRVAAMKLLGAAPIMMPTPDWYEALQRGVMKSALIAGEVLKGYRQHEVNGQYITVTPYLFNMVFGMVINKDRWESLPADIQKALSVMPGSLPGLWDKLNKEAYQMNAEHKKVEVIHLSDEENREWIELIQPVADKHAAELDKKGLAGDEILKEVSELAEKYNKEYPVIAPYLTD